MIRILYHIGFWSAFTLLFVYQNPNASLKDYLSWFWILIIAAIVAYTNLYYLLPRFYFKKKYGIYAILLFLCILLGSYLVKFGISSEMDLFQTNLFQEFVNLSFFVIITSSFRFYREFQRKQARLVKVENEQLKTELKLLKAQVNPHFLFNTLSNLYGLIIQNQNDKAAEVTLKLSDLMRYLLQSSKSDKVNLAEEVKFIEDYLTLEKIRLTQDADIQFQVSGLDKPVLVAPLLFIPLVENTFTHGLQSLSKSCYAHFTLAKQGDELFFEAKNSIGINLNRTTKSGTGLNNLRKRLELIYPEKHILEIERDEQHFRVTLQISL